MAINKLLSTSRLWHMRCTIARTCLCTRLKHWRHAKKNKPCLIKNASRYAADCTSKTATFFIFPFLSNTKILWENHLYLFVILLVQWWKWYYQKQPPEAFYKRRYSEKCCKIHRKTSVSGCLFNKFAGADDFFTYRLNLYKFVSFLSDAR